MLKLINQVSLLTAGLMVVMSSAAFAADGAAAYAAKGCGACHGQDGNTPIMEAYPKIAGQNTAYTTQQLKDFKSGARSNGQAATMKGIMAAVSDEEIAAISVYLSGL